MKNVKKLVALLLAGGMAMSMAACGSNGSDNSSEATGSVQESSSQPEESQTGANDLLDSEAADNTFVRDKFTVAWVTTTSLTCWATNNNTPGAYEVYEMLYECDSQGAIYPLLADATYDGNYMPGCDHEDGSGVYTIKIYDYIYDHNGEHVTASDVAFSFMHQYEHETTSGWGDLISVEAADDTTVVFTFQKDQTNLGQLENILCRCFIVSEASYNASASGLVNDMCGTGPFKFSDYVSGSQLTLVRNEDYWQTNEELRRQEQQANVGTLVYQFIDEAAQRVVALKTGSVDYVYDLGADNSVDFMDGGDYADQYNVVTYKEKRMHYLHANCSENSPLNDINLRLAVFNAVDLDGLMIAMGNGYERCYAYASDYYSDYDMVDWASLENYNSKSSVDADLVKQYLDAAGYKGETLHLLAISGDDTPATVIAAQLTACGINVTVDMVDGSTGNARREDSTAWDIELGTVAGDFNPTVWSHAVSFSNTGTGDHSPNFVYDKEWDDILNLCCTTAGHTAENMEAWWQRAVDNAYIMGVYTNYVYDVVPKDTIAICIGDKLTPVPGAFSFAASE